MVVSSLPRWDMSVVFPGLNSDEYRQDVDRLEAAVHDLERQFDDLGIGQGQRPATDDETVRTFETLLTRFGDLVDRAQTIGSYTQAFVAVDSSDTLAQARSSELRRLMVELSQLDVRFTDWIGGLDVEGLIARSAIARDHAYTLRRTKIEAEHQMSLPEERLAAQLNLSGGSAWGRLHSDLSSQIEVTVDAHGEERTVPMSVARSMATDPDRAVRKAAYESELRAWERHALPLAAALNGVKGQTNTLNDHRGWPSALDLALFNNGIDRATLEAMMGASRDAFSDFRRYLKAKARALGVPRLAWFDIVAPVGDDRPWDFDEARSFLLGQFETYSPRLRELGERAFRERWIDAEPRPGKRDGAFCMRLRGGESRILSNFRPSYEGMTTMAHELGHAYHNLNLGETTAFQRATPMTLAETASTFCENIVAQAAMRHAPDAERLAILEASLQRATQEVLDISSRFLFEQQVFERRRQRELGIEELNNLMLDSQQETYGDALDADYLHPYMWAVKGHYYSVGRPF